MNKKYENATLSEKWKYSRNKNINLECNYILAKLFAYFYIEPRKEKEDLCEWDKNYGTMNFNKSQIP